jgi:hypothetical protein
MTPSGCEATHTGRPGRGTHPCPERVRAVSARTATRPQVGSPWWRINSEHRPGSLTCAGRVPPSGPSTWAPRSRPSRPWTLVTACGTGRGSTRPGNLTGRRCCDPVRSAMVGSVGPSRIEMVPCCLPAGDLPQYAADGPTSVPGPSPLTPQHPPGFLILGGSCVSRETTMINDHEGQATPPPSQGS